MSQDSLEENIRKTKGFVARAVKLGLATEAELVRFILLSVQLHS